MRCIAGSGSTSISAASSQSSLTRHHIRTWRKSPHDRAVKSNIPVAILTDGATFGLWVECEIPLHNLGITSVGKSPAPTAKPSPCGQTGPWQPVALVGGLCAPSARRRNPSLTAGSRRWRLWAAGDKWATPPARPRIGHNDRDPTYHTTQT